MKKIITATFLALTLCLPVFANESANQQERNDEEYVIVPFNFSVVPFIGINDSVRGFDGNAVNYFSLNMLVGHAYGLQGVEFGGLINWQKGFVTGLQIAGLGNYTGNHLDWGWQIAGLGNIVGGNSIGFQEAGLFNYSGDNILGYQHAGLFNYSGGNTTGFQQAGLVNYSRANTTGFQQAGLVNYSGGSTTGFQQAGIFNYSGDNTAGVQMAGITNYADKSLTGGQISVVNIGSDITGAQVGVVNIATGKIKGLQLGVFNYSDEIEGAPIGLVSYSQKGKVGTNLIVNETGLITLGLKSGNNNIYSNFIIGYRPPFSNPNNIFSWGVGFGGHIPIGDNFYSEIEVSSLFLAENQFWNKGTNSLNSLRLKGGWKAMERFSVFGGVSFNVHVHNKDASEIAPFSLFKNDSVTIWPGLFAGVEI